MLSSPLWPTPTISQSIPMTFVSPLNDFSLTNPPFDVIVLQLTSVATDSTSAMDSLSSGSSSISSTSSNHISGFFLESLDALDASGILVLLFFGGLCTAFFGFTSPLLLLSDFNSSRRDFQLDEASSFPFGSLATLDCFFLFLFLKGFLSTPPIFDNFVFLSPLFILQPLI